METFPLYQPFVRGIHPSPNNREAGDLRPHRAHYDVIDAIRIVNWTSSHHSLHLWNVMQWSLAISLYITLGQSLNQYRMLIQIFHAILYIKTRIPVSYPFKYKDVSVNFPGPEPFLISQTFHNNSANIIKKHIIFNIMTDHQNDAWSNANIHPCEIISCRLCAEAVLQLSLQRIIPHPEKKISWWRHQMEIFSALLAICAGNSPAPGEFPAQRPVTRSFDVFFDLRANKRLSKQSRGWWFETQSRSLWRHRNVLKSPWGRINAKMPSNQ